MPMYEYACRACGGTFEELVSISGADVVDCPACGSSRTERLLSRFQRVRTAPAAVAVGGGGGCCGGGCGCGH
jgi:putative FmdB family regulatory protein